MKILVQNLKTQAFFRGGIAWTEDVDRAFDFKSRGSAQDFRRENGLLHVAVVRRGAAGVSSPQEIPPPEIVTHLFPTCHALPTQRV
jgi:hypothetical protein